MKKLFIELKSVMGSEVLRFYDNDNHIIAFHKITVEQTHEPDFPMAQILLFCFAGRISAMYGKQVMRALPRAKVVNMKNMKINKNNILRNICYTDLVYGRINKKLGLNLTNDEIEEFMFDIINNAQKNEMEIIGKNYYISNYTENIKLTVNRNTTRIITADKIQNNKSINPSERKALENKPPVDD